MGEFVVVGAGGHARACIEVLNEIGLKPEFCISHVGHQDPVLGIEVLPENEAIDSLHREGIREFFVAIGSNQERIRLAELWTQSGYHLFSIVSPSAHVARSASIGLGVLVMPHTVVGSQVTLNDLSILNTGAIVEHDSDVGYGAHVAPGSVLGGRVSIGHRTLIGIGSTVIDGLSIGEDIVLGAGAVAVRNLTIPGTYVGVPARLIDHGESIKSDSEG
jgi:UDP-perosamine 4-acetyltransferase